jgi:hypothetical protein
MIISEIDEKFDRKLDRMTDNIDRMQRQIENNTSFYNNVSQNLMLDSFQKLLYPNLLWLHLFLQS